MTASVARVLDVVVAAPAAFTGRAAARTTLLNAGLAPALTDWLLLNLTPTAARYRWRVDARALAQFHARVAAEDLWPMVEGAARVDAAVRARSRLAVRQRRPTRGASRPPGDAC